MVAVEPLSRHIGAIIHGIDLNRLNDRDLAFIRDNLNRHLVVFFRDQALDPASLHRLAGRFGRPMAYPFAAGIDGYPEIVEVKKLPQDTANFGGVWHSDTAYLEAPAMGAMLYGLDLPESGGDTLFANMYEVLGSLSPGLQKFLAQLTAVNESDPSAIAGTRPGQARKGLVAEHPAVRTHPETGRPLLYVNRAHTTRFTGMTRAESRPLLNLLFERTAEPQFGCRFRWRPGSLAFWDNRACQHYPINDYHGQLRRMLRVSLAGAKPF